MSEVTALSAAAIQWLANGERGLSSEQMFEHLSGVQALSGNWRKWAPHYPSDPDDLNRCRKLLEAVPELQIQRMADCSPVWAELVGRWDELCSLMDAEAPNWRNGTGSAPKTYALMGELIAKGRVK